MKRIIAGFILLVCIINVPTTASAQSFPVTLTDTITATSKLKSFEYDANASLNLTSTYKGETEAYSYKINAKGKSVLAKSPSHSILANLNMTGIMPADDYYAADTPFSVTIGAESIFTKNKLYVSLRNFSLQPATNDEMKEMNAILKKVKNVWVKLSSDDVEEYTDSTILDNSDDLSFVEIADTLERHGVVTFLKSGGQSTINGKSVQRYALNINKAELLNLIVKGEEEDYGRRLTIQERKEIQDELNIFSISTIEVWIDETTMLPMKYAGTMTISDTDTDGTITRGTITADITLGKINSVKPIKAPKKSKTIGQMFDLLY